MHSKSQTQFSADDATIQKPKRSVEVDFCELEDGTLVELIENPHDATKSILAICENGQIRYVEKLERDNQVLVPIPKDVGVIRHVSLANATEPFDSIRNLLADIMVVLRATLELSIEQIILLASFVLSTWFVEKLPIAPYVAFVGPPGSGKTTALRVLNLLCRRSLLTADISSAAFYEACNQMTPTILIDEAATVSNRRELFHLLRAGTTQGFIAVRKNNFFKSYGARVVSWIELPDDPALNSRCILIPMKSCTRTDLLLPTDPFIVSQAKKLQRQLLQFRLKNFKTLALPKIMEKEKLQTRTRDLFRALALPLGEDKEICEVLVELLRQQESLREVLSIYQSAVLGFLYEAIHSCPEWNALSIMELTEGINAVLRQRGEPGRISEKKVSTILTSLHLTNRTRTNSGYVLWLDRQTREEIHSLARTYRLNTGPTSAMSALCELCQILGGRPTGGPTTKPIAESEANGLRERRELREHGKRRTKRKPTRAVPATSSRRL